MPHPGIARASVLWLILLAVTVFGAGCALPVLGTEPPTNPQPVLHSATPDNHSALTADLEALRTRVQELETRVALLERALLEAAPPVHSEATSAPATVATQAAAPPVLVPSPTPDRQATSASSPEPGIQVAWDAAAEHIGDAVTVCGPVVAAQYAPQTNGQPTFLNIGRAFPDVNRFQVVIWGNRRPHFPEAPEVLYRGKTVCVHGVVGEFRGTPEITLLGPADIWIVED